MATAQPLPTAAAHETQATVAADGSLVLDVPPIPPLRPGQTVSVRICPVTKGNPRADGETLPGTEAVTLGAGSNFQFIEEGEPPKPLPSLRGHLPTPPAVRELLAAQAERVAEMSPKARQRFIDDHNLSYYFGGREVAFRFTERGIVVLGVGRREIDEPKHSLPAAELVGLVEERVRPR